MAWKNLTTTEREDIETRRASIEQAIIVEAAKLDIALEGTTYLDHGRTLVTSDTYGPHVEIMPDRQKYSFDDGISANASIVVTVFGTYSRPSRFVVKSGTKIDAVKVASRLRDKISKYTETNATYKANSEKYAARRVLLAAIVAETGFPQTGSSHVEIRGDDFEIKLTTNSEAQLKAWLKAIAKATYK